MAKAGWRLGPIRGLLPSPTLPSSKFAEAALDLPTASLTIRSFSVNANLTQRCARNVVTLRVTYSYRSKNCFAHFANIFHRISLPIAIGSRYARYLFAIERLIVGCARTDHRTSRMRAFEAGRFV
jgi:hypothetical protein